MYISVEAEEVWMDEEVVAKFSLLINKLNACVIHLEQFPIKVGGPILIWFWGQNIKLEL